MGRTTHKITPSTVHRQQVQVAAFTAYGKVYEKDRMSMSEQGNHMSRIYHGSKELRIASTATDTHSSSPMDTSRKR